MRIAFALYNQKTDLDFEVASVAVRNADERLGILEALVELGHEVTIVSYVPSTHQHALKGESKGRYDNSWMTSLNYDLDADMQQFDAFLVETAATNTMFSFKHPRTEETTSYIGHFARKLDQAQGVPVLIYHHGSRLLSFPFGRLSCQINDPLTDEERAELSPRNYRNLFHGVNIWDGYDYTVWHKAYSSELFAISNRSHYYREEMNLDRIQFVATPLGYSERYDPEYPTNDPLEVPYDLVYVGRNDRGSANEGNRPDKVHHFYDHPDLKSLIVGKGWDDEEKETWEHNVETPGGDRYHGNVYDHYQKGLACVQLLTDEMARIGMETARHKIVIRAGAVCFVHDDIAGGADWVGGEEFVVNDAEDVIDKLIEYCDDPKQMKETNEHQKNSLIKWVDIVPEVLDVVQGKADPDYVPPLEEVEKASISNL